jgi:hypothetical protein
MDMKIEETKFWGVAPEPLCTRRNVDTFSSRAKNITHIQHCGHETFGWTQLYKNDSNFVVSYQTLSIGNPIPYFHLLDGMLDHLIHRCVP